MLAASGQVYIVTHESIDFVCPICAFSKSVNVARFLKRNQEVHVNIRCKCFRLHRVKLDRRNDWRKKTDIQGRYFFISKNKLVTDGQISITDLSYEGLGFDLLGSSNDAFGDGDVVRVQFKLFQRSSSLIKKEAVIKRINDLHVNATFREPLKNEDDIFLKLFFYT